MLRLSRRLIVMSTYRLCFIAKWNVCVAGSLFLQMLDVHYMNILEMCYSFMRWKDEIYIFAILYSRHKRIGPLASED